MKFLTSAAAAFALLLASAASADVEPRQAYLSPMATFIDDAPERRADDELAGWQLGLGVAMNDNWNLEAIIQNARLTGRVPQDQFGFGFDLQRVFNREGALTPYLFAGIGSMDVERDGQRELKGGMYAAGAGVLADIFGSSNIALRAEYRYRVDDALSPSMADNLLSIGLQVPFGKATPKVVDTDGDGVADGLDRCPGTPRGTLVGADGCELDDEGDGVGNSADQCPGTRAGARVDARGCELDSDGDGVADGLDRCPNTPAGASVDANGCELDSDGDGVVDRLDRCPGTRAGAQVDVAGCEIREEIRLPGVNFETNSDRLLPGAERVLNDAAQTLLNNPTITVEVAGHTDSDGSAAYNESLSERRALTVRDYLAARGVPMARMTARGYGESDPIASNANATGKAQNRRVVLRITSR